MADPQNVLVLTALGLGLVHTVLGPDHYLPFIVLGRAEGWSLRKTLLVTVVCGLGHVGSSILVGSMGVALGWSLGGMEWFEASRGTVAGWALVVFGAAYLIWGLVRAGRGHTHLHVHADGSVHKHPHDHTHSAERAAAHAAEPHEEQAHVRSHRLTAFALFTVFVLGPCEPLIPLLMVPAAEQSTAGIAAVAGAYSLATLAMMVAVVAIGWFGLRLVRVGALERYVHAFSGAAVLASGMLITVVGL